jgi:integrase
MAARTKRGSGTVDQIGNAFRGRLSILVDGKRERPEVYGKTPTDCRNALRKLQHKIESGEVTAKHDRESVAGYLTDWLGTSNRESSTILRYASLVKKVISYKGFAGLKMHELSPMEIGKLYKAMASETDSERHKMQAMLHSAFEDARHMRRIAFNPADLPKKQKPKYKRKDVRPLDELQETAFLAAIAGDKNEVMYRLALDSGARQAELWALDWADVDFKTGTIRFHQNLKDGFNNTLVRGETKVHEERSLSISAETLAALREFRKADMSRRLLFPNAVGGFIRRNNFGRRDWASIVAKAGLEDEQFTFHVLRHTCATMLLRAGESIANVSKRLGHSKISTTLDYYGHVLPQDERACANAFSARLRKYGLA